MKKKAVVGVALLLVLGLLGCRGVRAEKPVIYLYPEQEMEISVKLEVTGELTTTYPKYEEGWTVTAQPDGTLFLDGRAYHYLYWEAQSRTDYDFSRGFVVPGDEAATFLEEKLELLGLTSREANEFIVYWLPRLEANAWNLVTFQQEAYTDSAKLTITPEPDSMLRVYMAFKALSGPIEIAEPELQPFVREGFAVIEWGGCEVE